MSHVICGEVELSVIIIAEMGRGLLGKSDGKLTVRKVVSIMLR